MRVLHLSAGNLFGGIETYLLTIARLRDLCPEMEPFFGVCFPGRLRDEFVESGVPVVDLGPIRLSRPWTILRGRRRLEAAIRKQGIEAVITHGCWLHVAFAPAVRRAGVRLLNYVHGELGSRNWTERWAARTPPDAVLANSRFTARSVGAVFPMAPIEVCYPVRPPEVDDPEEIRREVRQTLDVPLRSTVILQASRLERWKGQDTLVKALSELKETPDWCAWIAGGPQKAGEEEFLDELKSEAKRAGTLDRIRFLGQRSDVQRIMRAADIYCQPNSGPEPFGIAFIEALYAGLPVVSSDFGGAAEIITPSCGILCEPGNVGAVSSALKGLIADPALRRKLGEAGPGRAAELCDPRRQLAILADVIAAIRGASI